MTVPPLAAGPFLATFPPVNRLLLIPALALASLASAQTSPVQAPLATEAAIVYADEHRVNDPARLPPALKGVFTRLAEADTAIIPFLETRRMGIIKRPVELTGTMRYSKKAGLSIAYEQPKPRVLIIDDVGLIERKPDGSERRVAKNERPELTILTDVYLNLLRGRPVGLFGVCEVYFMGNSKDWQIGLIPKDPALRRHTGRVLIGGAGREIAQIANLLENGDTRMLRLSKSEIDAKFTPSVFQSYFRTAPQSGEGESR